MFGPHKTWFSIMIMVLLDKYFFISKSMGSFLKITDPMTIVNFNSNMIVFTIHDCLCPNNILHAQFPRLVLGNIQQVGC